MTSVHPLEPTNNSTKYRNYAASVDKALKAFEYTNDWADLIASLGKLCKVFQSHARSFDDIPKTVTVAKRLSQCLHPALPSGVHLKTLDTYKQVFSVLGQSDKLARCLYLFTIGLFPLMDNCGIKVKLELMSVFEKFLLPLGPKIRPALPGFIAAILFALEEGTDFYNPAIELLDQVMESSGPLSFYACLWQAVRGSPAVRLPALIFVNSKFDKRKPIDDQLAVISGGSLHADYMTDALCAVAEDPGNPLVQRNLLDFLCTAIPLNSAHVAQSDLVQILKRCLFVVLRRDMSLNRRLYQWLLNRQSDGAQPALGGAEELTDLDFFYTYSIPLIRLAIADFLPQQTVEIPVNTSPLPLSDSWKDHRIILCNFGLAKRFGAVRGADGSPDFMSAPCHRREPTSMVDDMQSWLIMVVLILLNELPWMSVNDSQKVKKFGVKEALFGGQVALKEKLDMKNAFFEKVRRTSDPHLIICDLAEMIWNKDRTNKIYMDDVLTYLDELQETYKFTYKDYWFENKKPYERVFLIPTDDDTQESSPTKKTPGWNGYQ